MNRHFSAVLLAGICALAFGAAHAQTTAVQSAPAGAAADADQLATVVVTASRIERSGFVSPTPVTTVSSADIAASGVSNIADLLNQVPSLRPTYTSTSADTRSTFPGVNFEDLRGLGPNRTLVLVNGERLVPQVGSFSSTPSSHANDMNVLPTIAIQRVDVVTGGASAAWGSDALAGVVNLQLYKRYDGVKLDVSGGASQYGDNASQDVGLLAGTSFLDGRAHVVVAAAFDHNSGVGDMFTRPWGKSAPYTLPSPACDVCNVAGTGYQYATYAPGGVIFDTPPLQGTAFGPNGRPYAFPYGSFISGSGEFGGSVPGNYPEANVDLEPPITRGSFYGYFDYNLTDRLTAHVTVNWADAHVTINNQQPINSYAILSGNPYIPPSIQAVMTANNIASFDLGVNYTDLPVPVETSDTRLTNISVGLDWDIGHSWKADAHYSHGDNHVDQQYPGQFNLNNAAQAADAVLKNGSIVCADPSNGCVPLDVFGPGTESGAALAYILQNSFTHIHYVMDDVAVNLRAEPFSTWAGPVSIATGGEYRSESQTNTDDAGQEEQVFFNEDNVNFSGRENVAEGYFEAVVPLAKDLPFIKEFDFNGADRVAKYSVLSQPANTWKLGATWTVTDDFLLRGTYSRDFRAPNLTELYIPQSVNSVTTVVPGQSQLATSIAGGNPHLQPEVAYDTVVGFTYRPHFIPGLSASVDTFGIDLHNVISNANDIDILASCAAGAALSCSQITKVNGIVTTIEGGFTNLSAITVRGTDVELDYATPLATLGLPGSVMFRGLGTITKTLTYQVAPGYPAVNYAGQNWIGVAINTQYFAPRFKGSFSAGYRLNQFSGTLVANYQSASVVDATLTTAEYPGNNLPAYVKWDLLTSYSFGGKNQFQAYGTINNLFNVAPPIGGGLTIPVNLAAYDGIGRTFKIGVRWYSH